MKNKTIAFTLFLALMGIFSSCNDKSKGEVALNETTTTTKLKNDADAHNEEGVVEITDQQAQNIGLEIIPLEKRNLGNSIKVTGTLELFPQDKANISPFVGGNVSSILVIPGDNVSKGQVLAYLEHPDIITMQQEFQEMNNALVFLKQDFERKQMLFDKGVSSGKDFQMAQSKFRSTTSVVNGLNAKLRLLGINANKVAEGKIYSAVPIITPIGGYVGEVLISLGDYVGTQSKMFSISDNSKIYVNFKVYEKDIHHIEKGQQIYFSSSSGKDELLEATVRSVGKTFQTEPKALEVLADIENNKKNLLPGMYVEGRIVHGEKSGFAVPEEAIVKEGSQFYIFTLDEGEKDAKNKLKFRRLSVIIGVTDMGFVEIKLPADTKPNIMVVTKGAYTLSSEMIKGELEHAH